jgi:mitochondrial fission protein ELM1
MQNDCASHQQDREVRRPFEGRSAWLITDGAAGGVAQLRGVAQALGAHETVKTVAPGWPWSALAPFGPVPPAERFGTPGSQFAPPWPAIALATARRTIPYLVALRKASGGATFTVVLQDPRRRASIADLVAAPAHDRIEGGNVVKTLTSPGPFTPARIAALRATHHHDIAALPSPRIAVIVGGPNAIYRYSQDAIARLSRSLRALAAQGASFLVTPSRRTPPELKYAVAAALEDAPRIVWNGEGENPYPAFLAHADLFLVTADSVNMASDAAATGRPIYVFTPEGGSRKFDRFHRGLRDYGATRPLPDPVGPLDDWTYAPLDAASEIAREIERRAAGR